MIKNGPFIPGALPATWLGVMGGGQLGRMFAHAAQAMGFKVAVLEPVADCPASHAADYFLCADYTDAKALSEMAGQCVAVTTEFENVPATSMALLEANAFVAPSAHCIAIAQDRMAEKRFFAECAEDSGVRPAPHYLISGAADIEQVPDSLLPGLLKTVRFGYDGKGQVRVNSQAELRAAFEQMRLQMSAHLSSQIRPDNPAHAFDCVLEQLLPLACEVSVLVARSADGKMQIYPVAENVHRNGILHTTTVPAINAPVEAAQKAQQAAEIIAERLAYVGVLCIEFFILTDGSLVINEMAPRPHNSGHYTIDACLTSQFSQQARAMAQLPLGDSRQHSPVIMLNLLGELWFERSGQANIEPTNTNKPDRDHTDPDYREPPWEKILALPGACLHLYGKDQARYGRKMGHVTFVASTLQIAQQSLHAACAILNTAP
jgi:5-(carboxyamino)imidazole ribonucleotide synthase